MATTRAPLSGLESSLGSDGVRLLQRVVEQAEGQALPLYLVGGAVRDMLLGRPLKEADLDLVVEGDAALLARALAQALGGEVLSYSQFRTAKVRLWGRTIDLVTARSETYRRPGALPAIRPASIQEDLARRDFTINALALRLAPPSKALLDPHGGVADLEAGLVRVLHARSFQDDATRIFRALRYEQRLGFRLEADTEGWLRRDVGYVSAIGGVRVRRELELIFQEERPELALERAANLGVLAALCVPFARLSGLPSTAERLREVVPGPQGRHYLDLLVFCSVEAEEVEGVATRLALPKAWAQSVRDVMAVREAAAGVAGQSPADVVRRLHGVAVEAVQVVAALAPEPAARDTLLRYLHQWRHVRPALTGRDLLRRGVPQGPAVGRMLEALREALLEGRVWTRAEEEAFVRECVSGLE